MAKNDQAAPSSELDSVRRMYPNAAKFGEGISPPNGPPIAMQVIKMSSVIANPNDPSVRVAKTRSKADQKRVLRNRAK